MAARLVKSVEELKELVGQEIGPSDWVEVTQERINRFADTTEDHQWIHIDRERAARESPYQTTIAHGFLTLSLLPMLWEGAVEVKAGFNRLVNYGLNRVRFPAAVPAGSKVRAHFAVRSVDDIAGGIQIAWVATVEVETSEKPCLVAEWLMRAYQ